MDFSGIAHDLVLDAAVGKHDQHEQLVVPGDDFTVLIDLVVFANWEAENSGRVP